MKWHVASLVAVTGSAWQCTWQPSSNRQVHPVTTTTTSPLHFAKIAFRTWLLRDSFMWRCDRGTRRLTRNWVVRCNLMAITGSTWQYVVKVQRSLAPLSRFRGSHIPSAHEQECCRFQSMRTLCDRLWNLQAKFTLREPHSWDPRQRTTWSRVVTSDFNSVLRDVRGCYGVCVATFQ